MQYLYSKADITQHVVKFGVNLTPAFSPVDDKVKLQDYANWLVEKHSHSFETLTASPGQLVVKKKFHVESGKTVEIVTFALTPSGPLFALPQTIFIDSPQQVEIPDRFETFLDCVTELAKRFPTNNIFRVGVINEYIFDTGAMNSLEITKSVLTSQMWREKLSNISLRVELPLDDKNLSLEIRPTQLRKQGNDPAAAGYGIIVNADINNRISKQKLEMEDIQEVMKFADEYVPDSLISLLNSEI